MAQEGVTPRKQIKKRGKKKAGSIATHVVEGLKKLAMLNWNGSRRRSRVPLIICNVHLGGEAGGVYKELNPYFYIALSRFPLHVGHFEHYFVILTSLGLIIRSFFI